MNTRPALIDKERFGPWALVTGESSGIGREFARQLAAHGLNVVLAARRIVELDALGRELAQEFGVQHRAVMVDLTMDDALRTIEEATRDLDLGLLVSNAGTGIPGEFLSAKRDDLLSIVRLNVHAHLDLAHHFGRRLAKRGRGGILLVSALGAAQGIPYMANAGATKAFVLSLGEALHVEFEKLGVNLTVLLPGPTATPVLAEFGIEFDKLPIKPIPVEQCVSEALRALNANRATIMPGRLTRFVHALVPDSVSRGIIAQMFTRALAMKAKPVTP